MDMTNETAKVNSDSPVDDRWHSSFRQGCVVILWIGVGLVALGFILPLFFRDIRPTVRRMECSNNLRQLVVAIRAYEFKYKQLPPLYSVSDDGTRLHSWRTFILPFMEQKALYDRIDLSKPWNDPANSLARSTIVPSFTCPGAKLKPGYTTYLAVVSPDSCLQPNVGRKLEEVTDGDSNTAALVECDSSISVHWMEPTDASIEQFLAQRDSSNNRMAMCTILSCSIAALRLSHLIYHNRGLKRS